MDDFSLEGREIDPVLQGLEKVNSWLGGYAVIFDAIKTVSPAAKSQICDWGCGGGDVLRAISRKENFKNLDLKLTGIDATPAAITFARKNSIGQNIDFILADVLSAATNDLQFDIVISTLFTHHFDDKNWVLLLQKMMNCSSKAVIIDDLQRHWLAYYAIKIITRLVTKSRLARNDGPLSVLKGFTKAELAKLLEQAGFSNYRIRWRWAFRWQIIIYKA